MTDRDLAPSPISSVQMSGQVSLVHSISCNLMGVTSDQGHLK